MEKYLTIRHLVCCCQKWKKEEWKYLWFTSEEMNSEEEVEWEGRVRGIKRHIERMSKSVEDRINGNSIKIEKIEEIVIEMQNEMTKQSKSMSEAVEILKGM